MWLCPRFDNVDSSSTSQSSHVVVGTPCSWALWVTNWLPIQHSLQIPSVHLSTFYTYLAYTKSCGELQGLTLNKENLPSKQFLLQGILFLHSLLSYGYTSYQQSTWEFTTPWSERQHNHVLALQTIAEAKAYIACSMTPQRKNCKVCVHLDTTLITWVHTNHTSVDIWYW